MNSVTDYVTKLVICDKQINNIITLSVMTWKSVIYDDIRLYHFSCPLFHVLFFIKIGDKQKREAITYLSLS